MPDEVNPPQDARHSPARPLNYARTKPDSKSENSWQSTLLGAAVIALGVYVLYGQPGAFGPGVITCWIVAAVFALTLLLLLTSRVLSPQAGAKKLAQQQQLLWSGVHAYRDATDADMALLDRAFYERATADLKSQRFQFLRDVVCDTLSSMWPRNLAILRLFLDEQGTTMAAVYHLRLFGISVALQWFGVISRKLKIVEFECELSDQTFVSTENSLESNKTLGYPFIARLQFPNATPALELLAAHRDHLQRVLDDKPGVRALRLRGYDDVRECQDRMQLLKSAYRSSPDFDREAEFIKIKGRPLSAVDIEMLNAVEERLSESKSKLVITTPQAGRDNAR